MTLKYTYYYIFFIMLLNSSLYCQETKLVVEKYEKSRQIHRKYFVLKKDKSIKNGKYYEFYKVNEDDYNNFSISSDSSTLIISGSYLNNKKNGRWIFYNNPKKVEINNTIYFKYLDILESGYYSEDKKIGIWETYIEDGKILKRFDFDNNIELEPKFNIQKILKYPDKAMENQIQGSVIISYKTNEKCDIQNIEIVKGIGYGCDEEAIIAIKFILQHLKDFGLSCSTEEQTFTINFYIH